MRFQKKYASSKTVEVSCKFLEVFEAGIHVVLT